MLVHPVHTRKSSNLFFKPASQITVRRHLANNLVTLSTFKPLSHKGVPRKLRPCGSSLCRGCDPGLLPSLQPRRWADLFAAEQPKKQGSLDSWRDVPVLLLLSFFFFLRYSDPGHCWSSVLWIYTLVNCEVSNDCSDGLTVCNILYTSRAVWFQFERFISCFYWPAFFLRPGKANRLKCE